MSLRGSDSILYRGCSMTPVLEEGDEIIFHPYRSCKIKRGDIIVFSPPGDHGYVIHRVVATGTPGIRTQGDNNTTADPWLLDPADILGRAIAVRRGNRHSAMSRGIRSEWTSRAVRRLRNVRTRIVHTIDPFLESNFYSGRLSGCLPTRYQPRILSFSRPYGKEYLVAIGGCIVGRRFAGSDTWHIRRRWKPFIRRENLEFRI